MKRIREVLRDGRSLNEVDRAQLVKLIWLDGQVDADTQREVSKYLQEFLVQSENHWASFMKELQIVTTELERQIRTDQQ